MGPKRTGRLAPEHRIQEINRSLRNTTALVKYPACRLLRIFGATLWLVVNLS